MGLLADFFSGSTTEPATDDFSSRLEKAKTAYKEQFGKDMPITSRARTREEQQALFEQYKGTKYDWFSLIAFVGLSASDSDKLYCFEWMWLAVTQQNPNFRVTPEILLALR